MQAREGSAVAWLLSGVGSPLAGALAVDALRRDRRRRARLDLSAFPRELLLEDAGKLPIAPRPEQPRGGSHRLGAKDTTLSRWRHGFESRWDHQHKRPEKGI